MDFIRRNINKTQRNGNIYINVSGGSYYGGGSSIVGGGGSPSNEGNYLPATKNADGTYTVDLTQVNFNGHIIAQGEVSAYGFSSGTTSGDTTINIDIEDNLTSTRSDAALSANQGRLLKQMIDEKEVDLSNYYTKTQVDDLIDNIDVGDVNVDLSNYYTKTEVDEKDNLKLNKSIWDDIFEVNSDGSLKVKVNLYGDGEISAFGSVTTENDINLDNYYTKNEVNDLIDNIDVGDVDVDLSNYYTKDQTDTKLNSYATTTALNNHTGSTSSHVSTTDRNYWNAKSDAHSHPYASTVKLGSTSYNVSGNTISLPAYPTLSSLSGVSTSTFNSHTGNTTAHITAAERTAWNGKADAHTHPYAGSSSQGGAATSANKLNTNGGGATQPVYFANGVPVACTSYANASVNYANSAGSATNATNADKLDGYHGSSSNSGNTYVLRNSDGSINVGAINASGNTNIVGNLTVTGEITAFADGGNATPFIYNASSYSSINSTSTSQVATANVAYLIKQEL